MTYEAAQLAYLRATCENDDRGALDALLEAKAVCEDQFAISHMKGLITELQLRTENPPPWTDKIKLRWNWPLKPRTRKGVV